MELPQPAGSPALGLWAGGASSATLWGHSRGAGLQAPEWAPGHPRVFSGRVRGSLLAHLSLPLNLLHFEQKQVQMFQYSHWRGNPAIQWQGRCPCPAWQHQAVAGPCPPLLAARKDKFSKQRSWAGGTGSMPRAGGGATLEPSGLSCGAQTPRGRTSPALRDPAVQ